MNSLKKLRTSKNLSLAQAVVWFTTKRLKKVNWKYELVDSTISPYLLFLYEKGKRKMPVWFEEAFTKHLEGKEPYFPDSIMDKWKNYKGEKCKYITVYARMRKGMTFEEAIKPRVTNTQLWKLHKGRKCSQRAFMYRIKKMDFKEAIKPVDKGK